MQFSHGAAPPRARGPRPDFQALATPASGRARAEASPRRCLLQRGQDLPAVYELRIQRQCIFNTVVQHRSRSHRASAYETLVYAVVNAYFRIGVASKSCALLCAATFLSLRRLRTEEPKAAAAWRHRRWLERSHARCQRRRISLFPDVTYGDGTTRLETNVGQLDAVLHF